jgi:hypothetical protein
VRSSAWGVAFVLLATAACVTRSAAVDPVSADGLDARSAADRQMRAFGEANPQCPLWTNWERLCSRTGSGGGIHCNVDTSRRVSPSEPFCVTASPSQSASAFASNFSSARVSSTRFCRQIRDASETQEAISSGEPTLCASYAPDRPFNGRRIAAVRHRWCEAWSDAIDGRLVCSEGAVGTTPSCSRLASRRYEHEHLLTCSAWRSSLPCRRPIAGPPRRTTNLTGIIVGGVPDADGNAAWGTLCAD